MNGLTRKHSAATPFPGIPLLSRGLPLQLLYLPIVVPFLAACAHSPPPPGAPPRPYAVSEVTLPPRLLRCLQYDLPRPGEIYENNVLVEFDVSTQGTVMNARVVENGAVISTTASYGEALSRARSCEFRPGEIWGTPVPVRMSMWFLW